jgi:hypothetical protein
MQESVAFVLCIENNAIREQALLLIESIRTFAGKHRDAEIIAISTSGLGVEAVTQRRLAQLNVRYVDLPLNRGCPDYGPTNRIYGAAWAALVFGASETAIALLTSTPGPAASNVLTNAQIAAARDVVDRYAGAGRVLTHTIVHPNLGPHELDIDDAGASPVVSSHERVAARELAVPHAEEVEREIAPGMTRVAGISAAKPLCAAPSVTAASACCDHRFIIRLLLETPGSHPILGAGKAAGSPVL